MMISTQTLEQKIEEKKFFIKLIVDSLLISMDDPIFTLSELKELRRIEDELYKLESEKNNDRNH